MISKSYILGQINKAVFKKNESYFVIEFTGKRYEIFPLSEKDFNEFLISELEIDIHENIHWDEDLLMRELATCSEKHRTLNLVLNGMDSSYPNNIRQKAIQIAEISMFANPSITKFILNRLFSTGISNDFHPLSASELASENKSEILRKMYQQLSLSKNIIDTVIADWKIILLESEYQKYDITYLYKVFTEEGLISDIVLAIQEQNKSAFDDVTLKQEVLQERLGFSNSIIEKLLMMISTKFPFPVIEPEIKNNGETNIENPRHFVVENITEHPFARVAKADYSNVIRALKKEMRQSESRRDRNRYYGKTTRNAIRTLLATTDNTNSQNSLSKVISMIDKLAKRNIIHKNRASVVKASIVRRIDSLK